MKIVLKKILFVIIGISILGILMYNISLWNQKVNFEKYATNFNPERTKIGLKQISKNWKSENQTWDNWNILSDENYNDGKVLKFAKIFSLKDINTGIIYENDSSDLNTNFQSKIIWLNSNILFWRNGIESEMDYYQRNIDSNTVENLSIRYYFKDDNGNKNYFEANHSIYELDGFYCGTPSRMEREKQRVLGKPYFGNITKKQADSILAEWKITRNNKVYN
ncbi:hypothetical protein [Aureivirga sp. CE67]|uniref:hypothetical protein n=1 Tax=Aureivirga sp. CE67 TaxID=1788983 RepID=UPI0018CA46ED|nr:hypothetical protein [Aureivirga sp. CE67]